MKLDAEGLQKRIAPLFQENFTRFGELGAAVSVWQNGKMVVDLYGGFRDVRRESRRKDRQLIFHFAKLKRQRLTRRSA